ncbi:MAG: dienelactone hydrolase [Myxococcales bacterium]|nr:dienelactone hydrolase [Myxococcales bacterium]
MAANVEQLRGVTVPAGPMKLRGDLNIPEGARGAVVFAHWKTDEARDRGVVKVLNDARLATLRVHLLTSDEELIDSTTEQLRFEIDLLAERLVDTTHWLARYERTRKLRVGYFGASTGAAAALVAAAELSEEVHAVVSRGGRPDLAGEALLQVEQPTLLIVGANPPRIVEVNRLALARLHGEKRLVVLPEVSQRFETPAALEQVAHLAREWFELYVTLDRHLA